MSIFGGPWEYTGLLDSSTVLTGFTAGSVLFVDASTSFGEDNANFFYDSSNVRLGIGTASPSYTLDIRQAAVPLISLLETQSGNTIRTRFYATNNGGYVTYNYDGSAQDSAGATSGELFVSGGLQFTALAAGLGSNGVFAIAATTANITHTPNASASGTPIHFQMAGAAHTTLAASTEANDFYLNLTRTVQFATGALTTQRAVYVTRPTYGFVGASTLTNPVTLEIDSAPVAGTNATLTSPRALRVGSAAVTIGATSAALNYATIGIPSHTVTITGTTGVTASPGFAAINIGTLTVTDSSSVTVTNAAAIYVAAAPAQAGSVTISNTYSIWVDAGNVRFDGVVLSGDGTNSAPSYSFANDTDTGIYTSGADAIDFTVGGARTVAITNGTLTFINDGEVTTATTNSQLTLEGNRITSAGASVALQPANNVTATSGEMQIVQINGTFAPTSGTAELHAFHLAPIINQSGGASGNTIGIHVEPTYTAVGGTFYYVAFEDTSSTVFTMDRRGKTVWTQTAETSGSPTLLTTTAGAHTTLAQAQVTDVRIDLSRTVQFTGTPQMILATQRAVYIDAPTYAADAANDNQLTVAATVDIGSAPLAGTNITITGPRALRVGADAVTLGATVSGLNYATIGMPAVTLTVTGSTQVTATPGFAAINIGTLTITDASAVTVDVAAAVYIAAAPAQAGSVTITDSYALFVDAGNVRIDAAIYAGLGSTSAASYSFTNGATEDPNTGMYSPVADGVALVAAGTQRIHCNGTGIGFNAATPIARPDYTITNPTTNRSIDVSAITLGLLAQVVGTLLQDFIDYGLLQ